MRLSSRHKVFCEVVFTHTVVWHHDQDLTEDVQRLGVLADFEVGRLLQRDDIGVFKSPHQLHFLCCHTLLLLGVTRDSLQGIIFVVSGILNQIHITKTTERKKICVYQIFVYQIQILLNQILNSIL